MKDIQKNIQLNGENHQTTAHTLAELIEELNVTNKRFAIEVNGVLVPKSNLHNTPLDDTAVVEVVMAVGGG